MSGLCRQPAANGGEKVYAAQTHALRGGGALVRGGRPPSTCCVRCGCMSCVPDRPPVGRADCGGSRASLGAARLMCAAHSGGGVPCDAAHRWRQPAQSETTSHQKASAQKRQTGRTHGRARSDDRAAGGMRAAAAMAARPASQMSAGQCRCARAIIRSRRGCRQARRLRLGLSQKAAFASLALMVGLAVPPCLPFHACRH